MDLSLTTFSILLLTLISLGSQFSVRGTVTQSPSVACVGDSVTVSCVLNVPSPGDEFISRATRFIIRNISNPILESTVNSNGTINGIDLSRFTAYAPTGDNITNVTGSITLLSYQIYDEGFRMGCRNDIISDGSISQTPFFETLRLNQPFPDENFRIRLNVSENSLIEPGLTFISSVPLLFSFSLYNNADEIETLSNITYSDLNSQSFMTELIFDVCYRMTASATCSDQVREITSNYFILPGVRNGGGSFQNVSTLSSHRIAWIYQFDSPLCNGSDLEQYYFISKNYFEFSLYRDETQESVPITEFDLNFPLNFTFTIPQSFDILNETILLRILFNGDNFTKEDIVFLIPGTVTQSPSAACVGESVTVSCVLNVPSPGDEFISRVTRFIIRNTTILESVVNSNGTINGIDLSRFTADAPVGNISRVTGSITLLSYQTYDEGLLMGCRNDNISDGAIVTTPFFETLSLNQAKAPSTPSIFQSECFGLKLYWLAPATDRAITQYYLYRNSSLISTLSNTTPQYTDTDPLILNAAYLYSLAAASCAGNSPSATILISVPDDNLRIRLNVSENSLIEPGLTPFNTSVPLLFNFTLYNNTDEIETLSNIAYSDLNSQSFMTEFIYDVCYRMTASVLTCSDQVREVTSKHFILPGVRNGSGSFHNVSTLSSHRIAWIYQFDSPLCNDSDLEEYYFISKDYFEFSLFVMKTQESVAITEFALNFPHEFSFTIPSSFDISDKIMLLRILFNGDSFTKEDVVLLVADLIVGTNSTVTQSPSAACIGDSITVSCVLNVPRPGDTFISRVTRFIIKNTTNPILKSTVNSNGTISGIDLSRFTADAPVGNISRVTGSITLLSYQAYDEGLLMGCRNDIIENEGTRQTPFFETLTLNQAEVPSTPSIFQSPCFGVKLYWLAPATDRAITQYYLYRNSSLISTLSSTTTQYTDTDPLILNAAYLYSLAAASCAGNSPSATILISVPDDNFRIRLNVSENSLIEPGLTPFISSVPLLFNFTLYNNTDEIETLSNIAYSDLNSQSFMTEFVCDVCYRMTASVLTCSDQVKEVTSNYFILPGVRNGSGSFQNVSTLSSHRIAWIYEFDSPLCNGNDLEEYYFISKNYFEFSLFVVETQQSVAITEFDLNFPHEFIFTIPSSFDISDKTMLLRILFNGDSFTKEDIVFLVADLIVATNSTVTQSPSAACVGENITVSCVLNVPSPGDEFISRVTRFIIKNTTNPILESTVNSNGTINGINLSRFTADAPVGNISRVTGSITLISYQTYDDGLLMGCRNDIIENEGTSQTPFFETLRLNQAKVPSTPSIFQSPCFRVKLYWLAPATDRTLTQYYLYRDSSLIYTLSSTTTQYTDTDPLTLNAAYLYSLAAASCAGNSTYATILISVPDDNFRIRLNVSENSLIEPGLTPFISSVPLLFNFTLYNNTDEIETLSNIAYSDLNSQSLMTEFVSDVCYRMTASVLTCSDEVKEVTSNYFILPGVRNGSGSFHNVSTLSSHRIAWIYEFDSPLCNGNDLEEYYFISKNYFKFSLFVMETQESFAITEFDLNFPHEFIFTIPSSFDISDKTMLLRILFNGDSFTKEDIVLLVADLIVGTNSTVTQSPSAACVGDSVTVSCVLNVPSPGDEFISRVTRFIIKNTTNPILESTVNSNGTINRINLSRFTADAPVGNISRVTGSITLLSYQAYDEGLLMGCRNDIIENEGTSQTPFFETLRLNQASRVTQCPSAACVGESITVSCVLNVPSPGDEFISRVTSFIIGNTSNPILESTVNSIGIISGIDLSRFTADAPVGDITRVTGSITLLSYQAYDEGLLMGCRNDIIENEGTSQTPFFETLTLNQAAAASCTPATTSATTSATLRLNQASTVTQSPSAACIGDSVTVSCVLNVPRPGDTFISRVTSFIIGNTSNPILESIVNSNGTFNGIDLSRFTADAPVGDISRVTGSITLLSYQAYDEGLLMGCRNDIIENEGTRQAPFFETLTLNQATAASCASAATSATILISVSTSTIILICFFLFSFILLISALSCIIIFLILCVKRRERKEYLLN